jgi:predicted lysophospholipase L1 biosynthesis ABC-type transport system permease subunit
VQVNPLTNFAKQSTFQMKKIHEYEQDIASIRNIMEKSFKFLSLSGLSGMLAGCYAIAGAVATYIVINSNERTYNEYVVNSVRDPDTLWKLVAIAAIVLVASLSTGIWLSSKKAKKHGVALWNAAGKRLMLHLAVPLVTGGLFTIIVSFTGHFELAAPAMLIFYGLALFQGSSNTYDEIRYLGLLEILLGLISTLFPGYGLIFWAVGFGVLHVVYGAIMYKKYDK